MRSLPTVVLLGLLACAPAHAQTRTAADSVVIVRTMNSLRTARGSGFFIGDGSWVVTAGHVVAADTGKGRRAFEPTALVYTPWTGRPYQARVVAVDPATDLALLRLPEGGFPALPLDLTVPADANAAKEALQGRPLRLYGFPLSYGEDTTAGLAKAEQNDARLKEITRRGETSLCVLNECPDAQPGWSGGPMIDVERGTVVAVFHSLYRPAPDTKERFPAGSLTSYLANLLRDTSKADPAPFGKVADPTVSRPANAGDRMSREMRSLSLSAAGLWQKAEDEQRAIVRMAPDDPLPRVELGRILLEGKRFEEGLRELQEAVRLSPRSVLANMHLGRAFHLNYDPKSAAAALAAAVEFGGDEPMPRLVLAEVQEENQKPDKAEETLRAALTAFPGHPVVMSRLGSLLVTRRKNDEGMKLLEAASQMATPDPGLSFIALGYARALDTARKFKDAESVYRQVIRIDPENAHAYYFLASLFLRQSRVEDAQINLNAGLRVPRLPDAMVEAFRALQVRVNEKSAAQVGK